MLYLQSIEVDAELPIIAAIMSGCSLIEDTIFWRLEKFDNSRWIVSSLSMVASVVSKDAMRWSLLCSDEYEVFEFSILSKAMIGSSFSSVFSFFFCRAELQQRFAA